MTVHSTAEIANGYITAKLYLPDIERGYYRGTRFDWSGVVASLRFGGHEYFGAWFEDYDPRKHDAIVGPAEEFVPEGGGLGYCEEKSGGTFIRIGVGVLRKPDEPEYRKFGTYEIVDPGKWTVTKGSNWIEFRHELAGGVSEYAYEYTKVLRLGEGIPTLSIQHTLKNTGHRSITTEQYNHNFFVIDGQTTGPEVRVRFPFELRADDELKGLAETRGGEIVLLREFEKGQSVLTGLRGFDATHDHHRITVENLGTGAGVRIAGDRPLSRLVFWSMRKTVCPEPYIALSVDAGNETTWNSLYEFYTLPVAIGR